MSFKVVVPEFCRALMKKYTYNPFRNMYVWFGFFWGVGAPLLLLVFHISSSPGPLTLGHLLEDFWRLRISYLASLLPPVFGVLFGALGTIRYEKDRQIKQNISVLDKTVEARTRELANAYTQTVLALSQAIEAKDPYTRGHCLRVWRYAEHAAANLGLATSLKEDLRVASYLHDIGKINIPGNILNKPGRLTGEEMDVVRMHPLHSERIVSTIDRLKHVGYLIRCHHEREDGSGYPAGLKSDDIPLASKILSTADALDAMSSDRPYRTGMKLDLVINELLRCSGQDFDPSRVPGDTRPCLQFDPRVVNAMIDNLGALTTDLKQHGEYDDPLRLSILNESVRN